jgi:tRNA nucleotidyltransferase/poly(A) polymerase
MLNLQKLVNTKAVSICKILNENGYQAFIVGGCVRDLLLGTTPKDWDIATDAPPKEVIKIFPKTIPTGLQHGTVTVAMGVGVENHFEVTTFRIEGAYTDGRRPEEVFFVMNIDQDLSRRDLTINAIAYDPLNNSLVDPFKGIEDLNNQIIKAVGDANFRFQEDGLRIMRVARFAARFGYSVESNTFDAMGKNLETLKLVSKERIQDELHKIIMSSNSSYGMQLLQKCGALEIICPLLNKSNNTLLHLDNLKAEFETKLAYLYNNSIIQNVKEELMSLKFSNKELNKVLFLLEILERYKIFVQKDSALAYKSFMAVIKNHAPDHWEHTLEEFCKLTEALGMGSRNQLAKFDNEIVLAKRQMNINGNDLLAAGMTAGPRIKQALEACYLEILKTPEHNTKYHLLEVARKF